MRSTIIWLNICSTILKFWNILILKLTLNKAETKIFSNFQKEKHLKGYTGNVYSINARKISEEALGRYFPNTPMLAAIVKVAGIMSDEALLEDMKGSFKHKFAKKPEVIEGNMKALEMALKEVKKL